MGAVAREEVIYIRGPFGFWPFPILNALILIIYGLRQAYQPQRSRPKIYEFVRDEKGRIIQILEYEAGQ